MGRLRSWKKKRVYRPELLLQQLEERIVLDAAVNPAPQDHPTDHPTNGLDHLNPTDTAAKTLATDAGAAGGAGGGGADLVAKVPDSYNHVFNQSLNVVLISSNLADVKTISDAAQKDTTVITYDAQHDNLATITAKLQDLVTSTGHKIDNLAIVGHSSADELDIGTDHIQYFTLSNYQATFAALGQTLSQGAQIQLFGCFVAQDATGQAMVDHIATYASADTFASTNATGGAQHDWNLEYSSAPGASAHSLLDQAALSSVSTELDEVPPVFIGPIAPVTVAEGVAAVVDVTSNFSDPDPLTYTATIDGGTYYQQVVTSTSPTITLPTFDQDGTHSVVVTATDADGQGVTSSTPFTLTVTEVPPVFIGPIAPVTVADHVAAVIDVTNNFSDPDYLHYTAIIDGGTPNQQVVDSPYPTITLPAFNQDGTHSVVVTATDWYGLGVTSSTPFTLTVTEAPPQFHGTVQGVTDAHNFTAVGDSVFFLSDSGIPGVFKLWVEKPGASALRIDFSGADNPTNLTVVGGKLFVEALDASGFDKLWMVDPANPANPVDVNTSGNGNNDYPQYLTTVGTKLFFDAYDASSNQHLWMVDSTDSTLTAHEIITNPNGSDSPTYFATVGDKLFFDAYDASSNQHLWMVDSTDSTLTAHEIITNPNGSENPFYMTTVGTKLFFDAYDASSNTHLWMVDSTDSTLTASQIITNNPSGWDYPTYMTTVGTKLFFEAYDASSNPHLWMVDSTDSTLTASQIITNNPSGWERPWYYATVGNNVLFDAFDANFNHHFWVVDSTDSTLTAHEIMTNNPDGTESPTYITTVGTKLFFDAYDANGWNQHLWVVDATDPTLTAHEIITNPNGSDSPNYFATMGDKLFFDALDQNSIPHLWMVDSTDPALTAHEIIVNPNHPDYPTYFATVGDNLYFTAYDSHWALNLRMVDSTDPTLTVHDITNGPNGGASPFYITTVADKLFFGGPDATGHEKLWMVDPTNPTSAIDVNTAGNGNNDLYYYLPYYLGTVGGKLFVDAYDATGHDKIWMVDPTNPTHPVDVNTSGNGNNDAPFLPTAAVGDKLFVEAAGPDGFNYGWVLDSTGTASQIQTGGPVPDQTVAEHTPISVDVTGKFTDLDPGLTYSYSIDGGTPVVAGTSPQFTIPGIDTDGVYPVVVTVTDADGHGVTSSNQFNLTVTHVNEAPTNAVPIAVQEADPSGAVTFSAANGNLISVSDVDAGTSPVKVTLTATHGTMTLNGVVGLTFDPGQGDGTADASMTFAGTLADINHALSGMNFHHVGGYYGLADVTITVNDQGNSGSGGPQIASNVAHISVEPYDVWFHGFGTETGWDVYNYAPTGDQYYTHDYTLYWQHLASSNTWNFWNGSAWVGTDTLGNAPYADGFGPYGTWFHDTVTGGTYENYDVYIHTAATYFSLDYTAAGATFWQHTTAGEWSYWDGSAWYATAGFNVEPVNVWFHGYSADATWDVYNQSSTGDEYFTHNQTVFWWHVASSNTWQYWNGTAWNTVSELGLTA